MVSVHTSSPPTVHTAYLRCLCDCSKCDSSGFDLDSRNSSWSIARLKEYLRKKRGHSRFAVQESRASWTPSISQSSSRIHTALPRVHPRCFSKCNLKQTKTKKSLLAQTSPALQPLPLPFCQLPIVSGLSIWPRRRRGQAYRFPLRLRASYSHLGPMRVKRKHRWHCTCFREVSSLTRFQRTGDGRVHRLLGTSMKAKIFAGRTCSMHTTVLLGRGSATSQRDEWQVTSASWAHLTVKKPWEKSEGLALPRLKSEEHNSDRWTTFPKAEEKRKLQWETQTTQPNLACDAPNLVPGP